MSEERIESFLGRWSRLKRADRSAEAHEDTPETTAEETAGSAAPVEARDRVTEPAAGEAARQEPAPDFSDFDFDALNFQSDYTQFMKSGVPEEVRIKALRKLWVSDPVLANMDGLTDYAEDYTDAAVCTGPIKTAYRFGRGFLSDEDVAKWEALGKPAEEPAGETAVAATDAAGEPPAEEATVASSDGEAPAETAPAPASKDWPETAAASGAACAAALKAEELAADEEDAASAEAPATNKV